MADFPALPLWTDSYLGDTTHLSEAEHGRYLLFLIHLWRAPKQRFPNDNSWLARKFGKDESWVIECLRPVISEFCSSDGNWIRQKRLTREWNYVNAHSKKQSARAKSRWQKEKTESRGSAASGIDPALHPHPHPHPQESKKDSFNSARNGNGLGNGKYNGHTTIKNPSDRIARFQQKLVPILGNNAWIIIIAACDNSRPDHAEALATCKAAAAQIGKGWPHNWPVDVRT